MRVLLLSNLFPPGFLGGYELAARDVARMLAARGHAVTVLSSPALDGAPDPAEPYAVLRSLEWIGFLPQLEGAKHRRVRSQFLNLRNLDALRAALASVQPDAVLCFNLIGLGVLGILRLLVASGMPTVSVLMDNWFEDLPGHAGEFASFRRVFAMEGDVFGGARIVGCSHRVLAECAKALDAPIADAVRIPAWVELEQLAPGELVCEDTVRFVSASRVAPHKGIDIVIQAVAMLRERGQGGFTVDVFGAGLVARAVQTAYAHNVEHLVRYQGARTKAEMLRLYHRYDALLFPTWEREPSGFVASEAAASGCLPVVTATMGGSEYLLDGHDCLKIARSPEGLAEAMLRLIAMQPAARLTWRRRLRQNARRLYDATRWYDRIERIVQDHSGRGGVVAAERPYQAMEVLAQLWSDGRD